MIGRGIWNSEEWKRLEQPLSVLDPDLERFAAAHGMSLGRNHHDCPERSLTWRSGGIDRLIQIYLAGSSTAIFCIWLCASRDAACQRFWKNEFVKQDATPEDVREFVLSQLLAAKARVESWSSRDLEPTRAQHQ